MGWTSRLARSSSSRWDGSSRARSRLHEGPRIVSAALCACRLSRPGARPSRPAGSPATRGGTPRPARPGRALPRPRRTWQVVRPDLEEQPAHQPRERGSEGGAEQEPDRGERRALAQHVRPDPSRARAEGHADADLAGALAGGEPEHAGEPHRREQQRRQAEGAEQRRGEARPGERRRTSSRPPWRHRAAARSAPAPSPRGAARAPATRGRPWCGGRDG